VNERLKKADARMQKAYMRRKDLSKIDMRFTFESGDTVMHR
jgi:hypothetical protein